MGRIALVYGAIGGAIVVSTFVIGYFTGAEHGEHNLALGFLIMIVALMMIFLGVKRERDRDQGGVIKFGPAFALGLLVALVAGVIYVIGWES